MQVVEAEEWARIDAISRAELEAIDDRARALGIKDLLRWERSGARPQNWLGIIRGQSTELRIVPKGWSSLNLEIQGNVQLVLLGLLARSSGIRLTLTGLGKVRPEPTLLELLYRLYIDACRLALRRRAIRTYKKIVESGPQMRGSLMFPDQALVRLVEPAFFVTSRTELTWDNPFNRVLAAACDQIVRCRREDLRAAAQVLAAGLHASPIPLRLSSDRAAARRMRVQPEHAVCLQLAELVLDIAGGAGLFAGDLDLGAQLVSTWRLWQAGIAAIAQATPGVVVTSQPSGQFALRRISGESAREILELRPDLLASIPSRAVLDTKWKLTEASNPLLDPSDLHQALDYARHFQVPRVVLLYPGFETTRADGPIATWATTAGQKVIVAAFQLPLTMGIASLEAAVRAAVRFAIGQEKIAA